MSAPRRSPRTDRDAVAAALTGAAIVLEDGRIAWEFPPRAPKLDKDGKPIEFTKNAGGYQTLNFLPSIATMILLRTVILREATAPQRGVETSSVRRHR